MKANNEKKREGGCFVDLVGLHRKTDHSRSSFSARFGGLKISVPSVRRSSRYKMLPLLGKTALYATGFALLLWGLHGGSMVLAHRGAGLDIINCLLAVFGGSFLVFLANHDQAVRRKSGATNK